MVIDRFYLWQHYIAIMGHLFLLLEHLATFWVHIVITVQTLLGFLKDIHMVQLISNFMLASTESRVSASIFLVYSIETCIFNHSTCVFKFVGHHGFTSMRWSSNSSGMHCKYVTSSDSSLRVHTSSSHALLEQ